jgi:riboflavin kinase / FMN adenylyltransferase
MQVHYNIDNLPVFKNAVVTIGTFDGVHAGHLQIINQLTEVAAKQNGETVIITFNPHPRNIIAGAKPVLLLNSLAEKIQLLSAKGINHLVVVPFTEAFAALSAEAYVNDFLWKKFAPHTLIIGYDHRFGNGRNGDYKLLEKYAPLLGFNLIEIPQHVIKNAGVSSTRIRQYLIEGSIEEANVLLGYDYFFEGEIIEGNKLGRTIGYPTANLQWLAEEKLMPANGVYAVCVKFIEETFVDKAPGLQAAYYKGMMNIGIRPTIGGIKKVTEINIFDFDKNVYGKKVQITVKHFLRTEQKFDGLEALKKQLAADKENAIKLLAINKNL